MADLTEKELLDMDPELAQMRQAELSRMKSGQPLQGGVSFFDELGTKAANAGLAVATPLAQGVMAGQKMLLDLPFNAAQRLQGVPDEQMVSAYDSLGQGIGKIAGVPYVSPEQAAAQFESEPQQGLPNFQQFPGPVRFGLQMAGGFASPVPGGALIRSGLGLGGKMLGAAAPGLRPAIQAGMNMVKAPGPSAGVLERFARATLPNAAVGGAAMAASQEMAPGSQGFNPGRFLGSTAVNTAGGAALAGGAGALMGAGQRALPGAIKFMQNLGRGKPDTGAAPGPTQAAASSFDEAMAKFSGATAKVNPDQMAKELRGRIQVLDGLSDPEDFLEGYAALQGWAQTPAQKQMIAAYNPKLKAKMRSLGMNEEVSDILNMMSDEPSYAEAALAADAAARISTGANRKALQATAKLNVNKEISARVRKAEQAEREAAAEAEKAAKEAEAAAKEAQKKAAQLRKEAEEAKKVVALPTKLTAVKPPEKPKNNLTVLKPKEKPEPEPPKPPQKPKKPGKAEAPAEAGAKPEVEVKPEPEAKPEPKPTEKVNPKPASPLDKAMQAWGEGMALFRKTMPKEAMYAERRHTLGVTVEKLGERFNLSASEVEYLNDKLADAAAVKADMDLKREKFDTLATALFDDLIKGKVGEGELNISFDPENPNNLIIKIGEALKASIRRQADLTRVQKDAFSVSENELFEKAWEAYGNGVRTQEPLSPVLELTFGGLIPRKAVGKEGKQAVPFGNLNGQLVDANGQLLKKLEYPKTNKVPQDITTKVEEILKLDKQIKGLEKELSEIKKDGLASFVQEKFEQAVLDWDKKGRPQHAIPRFNANITISMPGGRVGVVNVRHMQGQVRKQWPDQIDDAIAKQIAELEAKVQLQMEQNLLEGKNVDYTVKNRVKKDGSGLYGFAPLEAPFTPETALIGFYGASLAASKKLAQDLTGPGIGKKIGLHNTFSALEANGYKAVADQAKAILVLLKGDRMRNRHLYDLKISDERFAETMNYTRDMTPEEIFQVIQRQAAPNQRLQTMLKDYITKYGAEAEEMFDKHLFEAARQRQMFQAMTRQDDANSLGSPLWAAYRRLHIVKEAIDAGNKMQDLTPEQLKFFGKDDFNPDGSFKEELNNDMVRDAASILYKSMQLRSVTELHVADRWFAELRNLSSTSTFKNNPKQFFNLIDITSSVLPGEWDDAIPGALLAIKSVISRDEYSKTLESLRLGGVPDVGQIEGTRSAVGKIFNKVNKIMLAPLRKFGIEDKEYIGSAVEGFNNAVLATISLRKYARENNLNVNELIQKLGTGKLAQDVEDGILYYIIGDNIQYTNSITKFYNKDLQQVHAITGVAFGAYKTSVNQQGRIIAGFLAKADYRTPEGRRALKQFVGSMLLQMSIGGNAAIPPVIRNGARFLFTSGILSVIGLNNSERGLELLQGTGDPKDGYLQRRGLEGVINDMNVLGHLGLYAEQRVEVFGFAPASPVLDSIVRLGKAGGSIAGSGLNPDPVLDAGLTMTPYVVPQFGLIGTGQPLTAVRNMVNLQRGYRSVPRDAYFGDQAYAKLEHNSFEDVVAQQLGVLSKKQQNQLMEQRRAGLQGAAARSQVALENPKAEKTKAIGEGVKSLVELFKAMPEKK